MPSSAEPRRAPDRAHRGAVCWQRTSPEDTTHIRLAVLLATLALALPADAKTVYLFRHCVRSINESGLSDFAGQTFPPYGVPADYCLPRGLTIYQGVGSQLRSAVGAAPVVIADDVQRNIDSARALAKGLGLDPTTGVKIEATPFGHCDSPSKDEKTKLIEERLRTVPRPVNATAMLATIDRVLGGAKKIADQPISVKDGDLEGATALAALASESFLMQLGGGMEVGWGRVATAAEAYELLTMQAYSWAVTRRIPKLERAKSSRMLAAIFAALAPKKADGRDRDGGGRGDGSGSSDTTIFLGHDTDVNGIGTLLDLGWKAPPFPDNTTAPNVGLRFEAIGGNIAVDFVYTRLDVDTGVLQSTHLANNSVASFCHAAIKAIDWSCASKPLHSICPLDHIANHSIDPDRAAASSNSTRGTRSLATPLAESTPTRAAPTPQRHRGWP